MAGGFRELVEVFFWEFSWPGRGAAPMRGGIDFDRRDEDSGSLPHVAVVQSSDLRDGDDLGAKLVHHSNFSAGGSSAMRCP